MNRLSLVLLLLLQTAATQAQDLRLFEEIEGLPTAGPQLVQPVVTAPGNTQPAFTLRSVTRFGDRYEAVLLDRGSRPVRVGWREGESTSVPGFSGFMVQAAAAGVLTLVHPPTDPCIPAENIGVRCAAGNSATLALATAQPLVQNGSVPQQQPYQPQQVQQALGVQGQRGAPGQADLLPAGVVQMGGAAAPANVFGPGAVLDANGQAVYVNPFSGQVEPVPQMGDPESQARAARQAQRAMRLRQFEPARIDPATLPPGTRIENTPFGDRIVRE